MGSLFLSINLLDRARLTDVIVFTMSKSLIVKKDYGNMRSWFEKLDAASIGMKTKLDLDASFERYRIFRI